MLKKLSAILFMILLAASFTACQKSAEESTTEETVAVTENVNAATADEAATPDETPATEATTEAATTAPAAVAPTTQAAAAASSNNTSASETNATNGTKKTDSNYTYSEVVSDITYSTIGKMTATDIFTNRDLTQNADLTDATYYTVTSGSNISITSEGVYVFSGNASDVTITVNAGDEDKVQLVLDGVGITNSSKPAIYVVNADKVFVTTASGSTNSLSVTGSFTADGTTNTDAVIFSKDDLVINGLGTLNIRSSNNGITSKDDLKVTGGTLHITCSADALEANDSIAIAGGSISINTGKDGLHAENDEDNTVGTIYICGCSLDITAGSDGIQATTVVQIDNGNISISASEGIEGTYVQINGGTINISASDDGINASNKSNAVSTAIEINGGDITVNMGQGDTDGVDSNGNLIINGGTIRVNAQSPFDYDGTAQKNGGTIYVNGTQTDAITNQMMGGMGGMQQGGMPQNNMQGGMNRR